LRLEQNGKRFHSLASFSTSLSLANLETGRLVGQYSSSPGYYQALVVVVYHVDEVKEDQVVDGRKDTEHGANLKHSINGQN